MRGNGKEEYGWAGKKRLFRRMDMGMIPQRLPYGGMTRIRFKGSGEYPHSQPVAGLPCCILLTYRLYYDL